MPIGGSNVGWNEAAPADGDSAGQGDDQIRSTKTSVREAMGNEHLWSSGGGANTGYHLFGSARPYYGAQSLVSSSGSDGRLMLTSDSSRLFAVGSVATSLIGGPTVLLSGTYPGTIPQRHYWAIESGQVQTGGTSAAVTLTFPNSGFSNAPVLQLTPRHTSGQTAIAVFTTLNSTSATIITLNPASGNSQGGVTVHYFSIGTRVL